MERIKTLKTASLCESAKNGGCGECQTSCQSACKTSCGVANQKCRERKQIVFVPTEQISRIAVQKGGNIYVTGVKPMRSHCHLLRNAAQDQCRS